MKQRTLIVKQPAILVTALLLSLNLALGDQPLYKNPNAPLEQRVNDLFGRLTQDEKLSLLGGTGFTTQPIPRLGVLGMGMADAGQGVRGGVDATTGPATAFPAGVLMASTWDTGLINRLGKGIGEEAKNKGPGVSVLLGPAVNIHRSPLGGRNAEYMSEDPYLAAQLAVAYIQGVQSVGVGACVKHYACNNEETDRTTVNETVGQRALWEIYFPAFEAAVKQGHVWCIMDAYNCVNGPHCSASPYLLTQVLKHDWQFDGLVMSDWGAVHSVTAVQAGNDLEMPKGDNMNVNALKQALANGSVTQAAVDDSVHRILRTIIRAGLLDGSKNTDPSMVNSPAHARLAYEVATKGIVLLKNEGNLLPLDSQQIKSIAVIGEPAKDLQIDALGSPGVEPLHKVQLLDGIQADAGNTMTVRYVPAGNGGDLITAADVTSPTDPDERGFLAQYFTNRHLEGTPTVTRVESQISIQSVNQVKALSPAPGISGERFSTRWTGQLHPTITGTYKFSFTGDDGYRVYLDGKLLLEHWTKSAAYTLSGQANLKAGKTYDIRVDFFQDGGDYTAQLKWLLPSEQPYADAIEAAKNSDVAIVCASTESTDGEGNDRTTMDLPNDQDALIRAVSAANPKTIVVLNNGTPVTITKWLGQVPALVEAWYPGQEGGSAIADVLFGKVNPSGKLPDTLAASRQDYPDYGNFPDVDNKVNYAEGIYVGYRHFDKAGIQPLFPFGYGLSYTTFEYSHLKLSRSRMKANGQVTVSVRVKNTGKRAGEEVVELYAHTVNPTIDRPVRELKGFDKVGLEPGETKTIKFTLTPRDFAYFDVDGQQWKADAGAYEVQIGASSRDIRLTAPLRLVKEFTERVSPIYETVPATSSKSSPAYGG